MLGILLAAAAAQMSAPIPLNQKAWFIAGDVPSDLMRKGTGLWQVGVELTVDPDGVIRRCNISSTSGIAELDRLSCELPHHRAKFLPAKSLDGSASYGVYRTSIKWVIADAPWDTSKVNNPDVDLSVQTLPPGIEWPVLVRVMFAVDTQGRLSSCVAEASPSVERVNNDPRLVTVACDQIRQDYKPGAAQDQNGTIVPSVQDAVVRFSVAH